MDLDYCMKQLAENGQRVRALVEDIDEVQARWKPDPASWSILEVVCHLLDEEREDFRVRLDITLQRPGETWPGNRSRWVGDGTRLQQSRSGPGAAQLS